MPEAATFATLLRHYRERAGLSQEALAERAALTDSAIGALERGRRKHPHPHTVRRLAEALDLSRDEHAAFTMLASARGDGSTDPLPAMRPKPTASNLPTPQSNLIGRDRDLTALTELVTTHPGRLLTLTGIGGGGKTRLALAVAHALRDAFAGDVLWVELAPLADPALVPISVAAALAIPEIAGTPLAEQIATALQSRHLLLVLDNCEHLLGACADLAELLLAACPDLVMLTTSREPLHLACERRWRVPPLPAPPPADAASRMTVAGFPAVQLFLARARAVEPEFDLTDDNCATIAQICARLGGLPLALELAASRVSVLTPRQILARLDDAIRLLTGGSRSAPTRHQTLRATLQWSYNLLTPIEQAVLRRLAVCVDGCEIDAAEAVCATADLPAEDVLDVVSRLVDRSLVQVTEVAGEARYGLLEPVRQYALGLMPDEERAKVQALHAAYYLALAERTAPALHGPEQIACLDRLEDESGNLRAVLGWATTGDLECGLRLAVAITPFWEARGYLEEGRRWIKHLLGGRPEAVFPTRLRARALLAGGRLAYWQKQLDEAVALLGVSLADARRLNDRPLVAEALACLGAALALQGSFTRAADLMEESLALTRAADDSAGIAFALLTLGVTVFHMGERARAVTLLEESLARFQRLGDMRWTAITQTKLGESVLHVGDSVRALALSCEGLAGHLAVGDRAYMIYGLLHTADVLTARAQPLQAARLLGAMTTLRDVLAAPPSAVNQQMYTRIDAAARDQLSEADYLAAWNEGRTLPLIEAVARTLNGMPREDVTGTPSPTMPDRNQEAAAPVSLTPREHEVARQPRQN